MTNTDAPRLANWAGNLTYASAGVAHPAHPEELADVVRRSARVKALGSRHSFGDVADTTGTHVVLDRYDDGRAPWRSTRHRAWCRSRRDCGTAT